MLYRCPRLCAMEKEYRTNPSAGGSRFEAPSCRGIFVIIERFDDSGPDRNRVVAVLEADILLPVSGHQSGAEISTERFEIQRVQCLKGGMLRRVIILVR